MLREGRHCSSNDLECKLRKPQSLCQSMQDTLTVIVGVLKTAVLVRKYKCLRSRIRTTLPPLLDIFSEFRRNMNCAKAQRCLTPLIVEEICLIMGNVQKPAQPITLDHRQLRM